MVALPKPRPLNPTQQKFQADIERELGLAMDSDMADALAGRIPVLPGDTGFGSLSKRAEEAGQKAKGFAVGIPAGLAGLPADIIGLPSAIGEILAKITGQDPRTAYLELSKMDKGERDANLMSMTDSPQEFAALSGFFDSREEGDDVMPLNLPAEIGKRFGAEAVARGMGFGEELDEPGFTPFRQGMLAGELIADPALVAGGISKLLKAARRTPDLGPDAVDVEEYPEDLLELIDYIFDEDRPGPVPPEVAQQPTRLQATGDIAPDSDMDDFVAIMMQVESEDNAGAIASLVSNDRAGAADVAGEILDRSRGGDLGAAADPVNEAVLNNVRANFAEEAEMFVEQQMGLGLNELTPDTPVTVYRVGNIEPGEIQSFSMTRNIENMALPGQQLRERRGEARQDVVEYTVRAGDILAAPNASLRSGRGTEGELEVLIDSANVSRVDDVIEGEIVTPATAPEAEEAAELFEAAAEARRQQEVAEPSSSLFESPEAGSQYAYDAVQGDQIGAFQALPDRRSANKTFTIDDTDEFGGEVSHFSNIMTTIASRGERNKLPKKAGQLDALFSKGTSRPEYENSKLREILREDPDKSYTVDEIAKLANENLPQTRARTYLASNHAANVASGKMPSYFERGISYSYRVDGNGEVSLSPGDTQLDPILRDVRQDAGRVIFSSTKPAEPIVFSDGSVIEDIPFTVEGHSYGQGEYPGFYAHSRFLVVEDATTGKQYMVPYEIQSDTINQIERARYAIGPDGSVKSLKDRLEKYNEGYGDTGRVRIPLTDETKQLIKKYDEIFPAELTRHAKADERVNELQGDADGMYYPGGTGRARDAIIPALQKRLKNSTHPNIASDVDSDVYTNLETAAILRDMDAEVLTGLGGNETITSVLDPLRQAYAADRNSVNLYGEGFSNIKSQIMGYDVTDRNAYLSGGLESIVDEVLARKGFVRSLNNEKTIIESLDYNLGNAIRSYIRNYAGENKTFMEHLDEQLSDTLDLALVNYISARRTKSLMNQNPEVEKYFTKPTAEQLSNARNRELDTYNQIISDLGVTDQQEAIADEVVDAVGTELKRDLPESSAEKIDKFVQYGKQEATSFVPKVSQMFKLNNTGYEEYVEYAHALEELRKVYESGDLLERSEIQRLSNDFDLSLSGMGEEGEMIRNLRKVIEDSGEGKYKGFIGIPPHSDNKQFFRFAPKALAKEAEKLGLDGIIFLDADDIVSMDRPQSSIEMFRKTYENELDKGLVDFQNASPNAVVRRDVNKRNPDGSVDPNNTFAAKVGDAPQDANLTPGGAVVIGGRGKGLRIIDFDSGNNREVLQRPIRRAKGGEVDLRPKKMIHSGIGAMAREMM